MKERLDDQFVHGDLSARQLVGLGNALLIDMGVFVLDLCSQLLVLGFHIRDQFFGLRIQVIPDIFVLLRFGCKGADLIYVPQCPAVVSCRSFDRVQIQVVVAHLLSRSRHVEHIVREAEVLD